MVTDVTAQTYYNIEATMPPATTTEQFQKMFQNLLIERFHLVFRRETRNFPGYALVVDTDGGPKIKQVTPDENPVAPTTQAMIQGPKGGDGFPVVHGPFTMGQMDGSRKTRTKYQERSMAEFVSNLGFIIGSSRGKSVLDGYLQPRVVDKTRLTGKYTFILEYYNAGTASLAAALPMLDRTGGGATDNSAPAASDPSGAPDIFTAVRKQLGLRLDKTADVPLDVIIVDSVDKTPTEN